MGKDRCGDEKPVLPASLQVEVPGLALNFQVPFRLKLKGSDVGLMAEAVEEVVNSFASDLGAEADAPDLLGTAQKLAEMKRQALKGVEDWNEKLKMVETWKVKVDRASTQLTKMREDYLKEVTFLKQQLHEKGKAEREGLAFEPHKAIHFNPSSYTLEDETHAEKEKALDAARRELQEEREKFQSRINTLNDQLRTAKMTVNRKEQLLSRLMKDQEVEDQADEDQKDGVAAPGSGGSPVDTEESLSERDLFCRHLEGRFGSLREAGQELCSRFDCAEGVGLADLYKLVEEVGYKCDVECLFAALRPSFIVLEEVLGEGSFPASPLHATGPQQPPHAKPKGRGVGHLQLKKSKTAPLTRAGHAREPGSQPTTTCSSPTAGIVDRGVGTGPCEHSFEKVERCNAAVQTVIDSPILEKAMEYYDKLAEDAWKGLLHAGEAPEQRPGAAALKADLDAASSFGASDNEEDEESPRLNRSDGDTPDLNTPSTLVTFRRCISAPDTDCAREDVPVPGHAASLAVLSAMSALPVRLPDISRPPGKRPARYMGPRRNSAPSLGKLLPATPQAESKPAAGAKVVGSGDGAGRATAEQGVQCVMQRVGMLAPFERWLPSDGAHEAQLQQVEEMATEVEVRLTELCARAERLCKHAKDHDEGRRERRLVERLSSLAGKPKQRLPMEPPGHMRTSCDSASEAVFDILTRHGVKLPSTPADGSASPPIVGKATLPLKPKPPKRLTCTRFNSGDSGSTVASVIHAIGQGRTTFLTMESTNTEEEELLGPFRGEPAKTAVPATAALEKVTLMALMRKRLEIESRGGNPDRATYQSHPDRSSRQTCTVESLPSVGGESGCESINTPRGARPHAGRLSTIPSASAGTRHERTSTGHYSARGVAQKA